MIGRLIGVVVRNPLGVLASLVVASAWGTISLNALWMQAGPHPAPFLGASQPGAAPAARPAASQERRVSEIAPGTRLDAEDRRAAERDAAVTRDLQVELAHRNFYVGSIDGRMGPQTEAAIRTYESAAGLRETGQATQELLAHIRLSTLTAPPMPAPSPTRTAGLNDADDPVAALLAGGDTRQASADSASDTATPVTGTGESRIPIPSEPVSAVPAPDPTIEAVQRILADLGYAPGSIDGQMGPATKRAIIEFESDRDLPQTGDVSRTLLDELTAVSGIPLT